MHVRTCCPQYILSAITLALIAGAFLIGLPAIAQEADDKAEPIQIITREDGTRLALHEGRHISLRYDKWMECFEADDEKNPGDIGIVFTGSSSMVGWKTVKDDVAPLPSINRAFGGSDSGQLWYYADRCVIPRRPKIVVSYIGDNDMPQKSVTVDMYIKYIKLFVENVRAELPGTRFVFLASKASVSRWHLWPKYLEANAALQKLCESDPCLTYVDINVTLLDENGVVRQDRYGKDKLHFKREVYADWTKLIKPIVERLWQEVNE